MSALIFILTMASKTSKFKRILGWIINPVGQAIEEYSPSFGKKTVRSDQWKEEYDLAKSSGKIPESMSYDLYQKKYHPMDMKDKISAKINDSSVYKQTSDVVNALKDNLTGETSLKIQKDTQNFNAEQAQIARDWDSIGSQTERAQAAGYNPVAAMIASQGGISFGSTSNAASSGQAAAPTSNLMDILPTIPTTMETLTGIGNFIGTMSKAQLDLQNAEDVVVTRKARIAEMMANIANLNKQTELCGANLVTQNKLNHWFDTFREVELEGMHLENMNKREQRKLLKSQTKLNQAEAISVTENLHMAVERFNQSLPREMQLLDTEIDLNKMSLYDILSEINLRAASAALVNSQKEGQDIDNAFSATTFDDAVLKFHNEMQQALFQAGISLKDYAYYQYTHSGIFGQAGLAGYNGVSSLLRPRKSVGRTDLADDWLFNQLNP